MFTVLGALGEDIQVKLAKILEKLWNCIRLGLTQPVADISIARLYLLRNPLAPCQVWLDALHLKVEHSRWCLPIYIEFQLRHPADVPATWADISKAKKLLGWHPLVSIEDGIHNTAMWYLENQEWVRNVGSFER